MDREVKLVIECAEKIDYNLKILVQRLRILKKASDEEIVFHALNALSINIVYYLQNEEANLFRKSILKFNEDLISLTEKAIRKKSDKKGGS